MSAPLTPQDRQSLHAALLEAFPTRASVEGLTDFELDVKLDQIAGPASDLTEVIRLLIQWCQAHGRLSELLDAVERVRPENVNLRALIVDIRVRIAAGGGSSSSPMPPPPPPRPGREQTPGVPPPSEDTAAESPQPGANTTAATDVGSYLKVLLGFAILTILALLGLVFSRENINSQQWELVKIVLAITCAIIAMFIPGVLSVQLGNWLRATGAMAVFVIVYFFPVAPPAPPGVITITGYMFYKGTNMPAKGIIAVYPPNNLKSNPTPDDGFFTLAGVPAGTKELTWSFGNQSEAFSLKAPGERYYVIPRPPQLVESSPIDVPADRWISLPAACNTPPQKGVRVRGYQLDLLIPASKEGTIAELRIVALRDDTDISSARLAANDGLDIAVPNQRSTRARQWEFSGIPPGGRAVKMALCLTRAGALPETSPPIQTQFWYRRFE